jgi:hypothetical protein
MPKLSRIVNQVKHLIEQKTAEAVGAHEFTLVFKGGSF